MSASQGLFTDFHTGLRASRGLHILVVDRQSSTSVDLMMSQAVVKVSCSGRLELERALVRIGGHNYGAAANACSELRIGDSA